MKLLIIVSLSGLFVIIGIVMMFAVILAGLNRDWEKEDEEQEKALSEINNRES